MIMEESDFIQKVTTHIVKYLRIRSIHKKLRQVKSFICHQHTNGRQKKFHPMTCCS